MIRKALSVEKTQLSLQFSFDTDYTKNIKTTKNMLTLKTEQQLYMLKELRSEKVMLIPIK
jgi:hypothetical protein